MGPNGNEIGNALFYIWEGIQEGQAFQDLLEEFGFSGFDELLEWSGLTVDEAYEIFQDFDEEG